ncbi:MAG: glycine/betaine ABC transporter permease [Rhodospirillaceae bacterium]|nr:glycine/betaine ABC transporter permease [Rhodospirillaceae bacterium]|tara:strand:- start:30812 stop:33046 length:2235 start_codon:yes stop_codon:yes gene_type:complete
MTVATQDQAELPSGGSILGRFSPQLICWMVFGAITVLCLVLREDYKWLVSYPKDWLFAISFGDETLTIEGMLEAGMDWFTLNFKPFFRFLSGVLSWPMAGGIVEISGTKYDIPGLQDLLQISPWPVTIAIVAIIAYAAKGPKLAAFCVAALLYMVIVGYWEESMSTLALVGMSVPLSLFIGLTLGLAAYQFRWARRIIEPMLDVMQTVPTFAYLIPILILFGIGPVVGMVASAIYASPPMVRNVMLGLHRVPDNIIESGQMSGCNGFQLLFMVRIPAAMHTIMIGVNQTIMAALSMVIIAAIIGGFADIGWEVLSTMRKAQTGQSLLAGLVIVLLAMIMDRISRGFAERSGEIRVAKTGALWERHPYQFLIVAALIVGVVIYQATPLFCNASPDNCSVLSAPLVYPEAWVFYPAEDLNNVVSWFTVEFFHVTDTIKTWTLYFFMLPMKAGLERIARPTSWGFEMTEVATTIYWGLCIALAAVAYRLANWRATVVVGLLSVLFFYGSSGTPWPIFMGAVTLIAYQVGGLRVALFALLGMTFMLVSGAWTRAMLSFYLTATAVMICLFVGCSIGILAAQNDRVSAIVRPINDTLQTMPLFVFLIPVIMVFLVGDFSALLAIIMYSIVPAIRYTEHGLRQVDPVAVEAARMMGCTERQVLWRVKLPLAIPEIMLGLNQVVMFALAMLVIAALVGTKGLGQWVYDALTNARFGQGVIAGGSMALMAMIADRIIQAWALQKKRDLGIAS